MNPELQQLIDELIANYMSEHGGGFATAWYFIADIVDPDGDTAWTTAVSPNQKLLTSMGLIKWAANSLDYDQQTYMASLQQ
jgi:hypothetical protein